MAALPAGADPAAAPFAASAEIEALGHRIAADHTSVRERLDAIIDQIFLEDEGLGFEYRRRPTVTATEALEKRAGNCLSLVNLFVSVARAAGIPAGFVEVLDFEAFYREEAAIVRSTHVIGGVVIDGKVVTVDFLPDRAKTYRRYRRISDRRAAAHFYNAVAVEAMLVGEGDRAEELFGLSLEIEPEHAETLNNLAVLKLRSGEVQKAIELLERALEIDPDQLSVMENLTTLYERTGQSRRATAMENRAVKRRSRNPFFLLIQAQRKIEGGDLDEARELLRRARRIDDSIPEVYLALGRIELLRERPARAESYFDKARSKSSTVQLKIDQLLAEHAAATPG